MIYLFKHVFQRRAEPFGWLNKKRNDRAFIMGDLTVLPVLKVVLHLSLEDIFIWVSIICDFKILDGDFFFFLQ